MTDSALIRPTAFRMEQLLHLAFADRPLRRAIPFEALFLQAMNHFAEEPAL